MLSTDIGILAIQEPTEPGPKSLKRGRLNCFAKADRYGLDRIYYVIDMFMFVVPLVFHMCSAEVWPVKGYPRVTSPGSRYECAKWGPDRIVI